MTKNEEMKDQITNGLNEPRRLESLYRANKSQFKLEFTGIYPQLKGHAVADCWHERFNFESDDINWGSSKDFLFVVMASLIAGFTAKLPAFFSISEDFFYSRNVGFIVAPMLALYFGWKNNLSRGTWIFAGASMIVCLLFINGLPVVPGSDTLDLACLHLLFILWSITGFSFIGGKLNNLDLRLSFLKFNGELLVMTGLILIAGVIMSGVTVGLFSLIGLQIEKFYFQNIGIWGLAAAPIVGTYLTRNNAELVGKVSPVIARIFSPLVLVMLVIYLVAILYLGKDPYNDRDFLLMFNALLIGVMALIFFSIAESSSKGKSRTELWVLFLLCFVTIVVNGIALSAILFRISAWGITPNRAAVVGSNILILIHLLMVTAQFARILFRKADVSGVGKVISFYLPVYLIWAIVVTFLFPVIFDYN